MSKSLMIGTIVLVGCASHGPTGIQAEKQPASHVRPVSYARGELEKLKATLDASPNRASTTLEKIEYQGNVYWIRLDDHTNPERGTAFNPISIYVPEWDGSYRLGLDCEAALVTGFEVDLDENTGVLVLRELAPVSKQGTVILACNLEKIGTQYSTQPRSTSSGPQLPAR